MDEQSKKTLFEQKLSNPETTLQSLMVYDQFLEMFRGGNPSLLGFLKTSHYQKLITFITVVGPEQDKFRSYQYPQIACDLFLTTETPKVPEILFCPNSQSHHSELIYQILDYFKSTPNYVLSGYVIKIIGNLYYHHPTKIQQFVIKGGYGSLLLKFLQSKSVAEFLIRLIVVEDEILLNSFFQQRKQLLIQVIELYAKKDTDIQQKSQLCFVLIDILGRLWTNKHKESGRFASQIWKIIEVALNQQFQSYPDHQNLVSVVMKNICHHTDVAPFLIKKLTKKIIRQLIKLSDSVQNPVVSKAPPRFSQKNLKFLTGLTHVMGHISIIQELLKSHNIFGILLNMMQQFQWNNIVHIELQKIFKRIFQSQSQNVFNLLFKKGEFIPKVTNMINKIQSDKKFGKGYSGCLTNILIALNNVIYKETFFGKTMKKNYPEFLQVLISYLQPKVSQLKIDLAGYKLNNQYAMAKYQQNSLLQKFSKFLDNHPSTEELSASISSQTNQALDQIEDESTVNQHLVVQEEKKQCKEEVAS